MKKFLFVFIITAFFMSCSSGDDDPTADENPSSLDSESPVINVTGIPEVLEVITDLQITINDESSISSQIIINGKLIEESINKNIDFQIDPFDYTIGNTTLEITAEDAHKNVSRFTVNFELKKLLFDYPDPISSGAIDTEDVFLAVNYSNGLFYKSRKIEQDVDGSFYADDSFERQEFIITKYSISNDHPIHLYTIYSYGEMEPGTHLLTPPEEKNLFNLPNLPSDRSHSIEITGIATPVAFGYNAILHFFYSDSYWLSFTSETTPDYFMYSMPDLGNPMTDYSYTIISDIKKTLYRPSDFAPTTKFVEIELPDIPDYFVSLEGYKDEEDYALNKFKQVFDYNSSGQIADESTLTMPLVDELFDVYVLSYHAYLDAKKTYHARQKEIDAPIIIKPLNIEKSAENIVFTGAFDYSNFRFSYSPEIPDSFTSSFRWNFYNKNSSVIKIPFKDFVIPDEVQTLFDQRGVILKPGIMTSSNYTLYVEVYKYEEMTAYNNLLFGHSYNQNEAGNTHWINLDLKD